MLKSTYSDQINIVLRERLVPKMKQLSLDIANIETYSYTSAVLEDYKRQFDYYSMVYDFLSEYAVGYEELSSSKLVNVVRLVDAPTRERRSIDYLGIKPSQFIKVKTGYKMYIDKLEVKPNTSIAAGSSITITVVYTPADFIEKSSIFLNTGPVIQVSDGFTISLQNKVIPLSDGGSDLVVTVQAMDNGNPITAPQVFTIPIREAADTVFYYGVGAPSLPGPDIQDLTRVVEVKSDKTLAYSAIEQTLYYAFPASWGVLTSIKDPNGFETISDWNTSVDLFGLVSYNIYEFSAPVTVTNYKMTFKF